MIDSMWDNTAHNTVRITFHAGWTWDNLRDAIHQADTMIASQSHMVHLIIDLHQAGGLPRNFMNLAGDLFSSGEARPNEGLRVVVGAGHWLRMAYRAFANLYHNQLRDRPFAFAANDAEAQQLITQHQPPAT